MCIHNGIHTLQAHTHTHTDVHWRYMIPPRPATLEQLQTSFCRLVYFSSFCKRIIYAPLNFTAATEDAGEASNMYAFSTGGNSNSVEIPPYLPSLRPFTTIVGLLVFHWNQSRRAIPCFWLLGTRAIRPSGHFNYPPSWLGSAAVCVCVYSAPKVKNPPVIPLNLTHTQRQTYQLPLEWKFRRLKYKT